MRRPAPAGPAGRSKRHTASSLQYPELGVRMVAEAGADEKRQLDLFLIGGTALVGRLANRDLDGVRPDSIGCVRELSESADENVDQVGIAQHEAQTSIAPRRSPRRLLADRRVVALA